MLRVLVEAVGRDQAFGWGLLLLVVVAAGALL